MKRPLLPKHKIITLLTDFGLKDPYVAMMKGVILGLNPEAAIVDISHEVQPQKIHQAAFLLYHTYHYFPKGTIHVGVVDPGVGTNRRAVLLVTPEAFFIAPDNGLLSYIISSRYRKKTGFQKLETSFQAFSLNRQDFWRKEVSQTFHGRDIFAPVAAHLSLGVKPEEIGEKVDSLLALSLPIPIRNSPHVLIGEVVYIDQFGNLITNIPSEMVSSDIVIRVSEHEIRGLSSSYEAGEDLLVIIGSLGHLEIVYKKDNAADFLKVKTGERVIIFKP